MKTEEELRKQIAKLQSELEKLERKLAVQEERIEILRESCKKIYRLDGCENNEWDAVERVMPLMANIAFDAYDKTRV